MPICSIRTDACMRLFFLLRPAGRCLSRKRLLVNRLNNKHRHRLMVNALVSVIQARKAESSLAALKDMFAPEAKVIHSSNKLTIPRHGNWFRGVCHVIGSEKNHPAQTRVKKQARTPEMISSLKFAIYLFSRTSSILTLLEVRFIIILLPRWLRKKSKSRDLVESAAFVIPTN